MVLKSDSSLLVNRKPLFVPEAIGDLQVLPCWVLRVSRLGKCIAPRYAARYYDAIAPGLDFFGADLLQAARQHGKAWTEAVAFEGSLAVGEMTEVSSQQSAVGDQQSAVRWQLIRGGQPVEEEVWSDDVREELDRAVARVSEMLTIRQGDLIYVASRQTPLQLQREDIIRCVNGGHEQLYCKIK